MMARVRYIIFSERKSYMANIVCKSWKVMKIELKKNCYWNVQVHLTDQDNRLSHNPTSWQYPIINYLFFHANNSTNTSEYFSLSLNTVNRKGNLRLPEFGQDDILVKPTSINNWILLPSEGCFDFYMRNAQNWIRSFCRQKKPWYLCSWQKDLRCTATISI